MSTVLKKYFFYLAWLQFANIKRFFTKHSHPIFRTVAIKRIDPVETNSSVAARVRLTFVNVILAVRTYKTEYKFENEKIIINKIK